MSFVAARRITARYFAGWTLRARLLAALIALLALICLIVGVVTQIVTRNYLLAQTDQRLHSLALHAQETRMPVDAASPPPFIGPGTASGTAGAVVQSDGTIRAAILDTFPPAKATNSRQTAALIAVPEDKRIHAITIPGYGKYLATAVPAPSRESGAGPNKVVVALPLAEVDNTLLRLGITEICVTVAGLIAVGLVGEIIIRRTLRPLNRVAALATRVSEMELGRGEVALKERVPPQDTDPRTEIGQVGASLNRMLGHVANALTFRHASETRVRQFVADASHELRTPLAAIRGYAELTRRVGDGTVSEDVAYAMRRVESESARMTTLVEDLLLLARLDAGRPLEVGPVDLTMLVVDVVSDAHVAGSEHEWNLKLPDETVTVDGDGPRLHQVLANLLGNARVHTPAGTRVTVSLRSLPAEPVPGGPAPARGAVIEVVDDGPGIPETLLPEVFERFARGDSSRSRAAGSTGLGLAIVAAVVEAHGGTVRVDSRPGRTVFTVTLPATPSLPPTDATASATPPAVPTATADHGVTSMIDGGSRT